MKTQMIQSKWKLSSSNWLNGATEKEVFMPKLHVAISVQVAQHSVNWARVMSNGIALHEMAEHNNN